VNLATKRAGVLTVADDLPNDAQIFGDFLVKKAAHELQAVPQSTCETTASARSRPRV